MIENTLDKFLGCMVGLAVGDAMGATTEFMSEDQIRQHHGVLTELMGGGWLNLEPGEYTDDTQMALCLLRSLVQNRQINLEDIQKRFIAWMDGGPKDIGSQTGAVLRNAKYQERTLYYASHDYWLSTGQQAAGNGGVMRCAPVALMHVFSADTLMEDLLARTCRMTHFDPRCADSCRVVGGLIREAITGREFQYPTLEEPNRVCAFLDEVDQVPLPELHHYTSGYTYHPMALASRFFHRPIKFEQAVAFTVNLGGDADTNGAVVGAVMGAKYGLSGIPERWVSKVQGLDEIVDLTTRLWKIAIERKTM